VGIESRNFFNHIFFKAIENSGCNHQGCRTDYHPSHRQRANKGDKAIAP
jgi:hypothetical protein